MKGSFFPDYWSRENCNYGLYADISVRAYCDAVKLYEDLLKSPSDFVMDERQQLISERIVICETFSAFSIESYLNTYAAACLGDGIFYDNYEKLSALSKLQLISGLLYHENIDKGGELHYLLKHSFSIRDKHAHNKSKAINGSTAEEIETYYKWIEENKVDVETQIKNASKEAITRYKNDIADALTSIKAIVAMASFIDDHDDTAKAKQCLFIYTNDLYCPNEYYREDMKSLINSLIKRQSGKN